jgi:chromosomal replication initiation ATPase DnaA
MKGKSRASTIILLAQWNTNLAYHLYQKKIPIIFQAVATTRSRLKLNKSDKISKEDIPAILLNRYNIKVDNDLGFDKSDSIAQAIAYIIKENIC